MDGERRSQSRNVVTGAGGALGRALVGLLRERFPGVEVMELDLPRCDVVTARFADIVRPGDVVYHLAAFVHRLPRTPDEIRQVHEVNHHATARLAAACLEVGATLVFTSTVAVSAGTEYGKSKAAAEEAIRALGEKGLRYAIVRFPLLYGPHGHGNMERMLTAIRTGRYWPIGDPSTPKSCLYLDDAARALVAASERGLGGTFVAAPDPVTTLGEIHAAVYAAAGRRLPSVSVPRGAALAASRALQAALALVGRATRLPEQVETLTSPAGFDGRPFAQATGFLPEVGLEEGMRRTVQWMEGRAG
ncbi:MAG: sugar nucleotide-binding protein [Deltaproteobacteria bacterium]